MILQAILIPGVILIWIAIWLFILSKWYDAYNKWPWSIVGILFIWISISSIIIFLV